MVSSPEKKEETEKKTQKKAKAKGQNQRQPQSNTRRARKTSSAGYARNSKGSPISSGIQPREEDKGRDSECDAQRKKNTERERGDRIKSNKRMRYTDTKEKHREGLTAQK